MKNKLVIIITSFLLLIFLATFWYLLFFESLKEIDKIKEAKNDIIIAEQKKLNINNLRQVLNDTARTRADILSYFVSVNNLVYFIESFEQLATSSSVYLEFSQTSTEDNVYSFVVKSSGTFNNLYNFINLINNMPFAVSIKDISFKKSINSENIWDLNFLLMVYTKEFLNDEV